ncbi:MAG: rRNA maturation RNase YbeY [Bryobacterales bacterium]|nr:rRNA maturation RNase YbeY [Bryobacterales bacterium]MDE0296736.1 rRNA maturation RNase YbeY [Bryobacterales bacterium]MDE0435834.1 rRNA maturation RNase YbeY [Bryobacterales bacterium]
MASRTDSSAAWWKNRQRTIAFDEMEFDRFIQGIGRQVARGQEFAIVIGSDESLRDANRRFRGKRAVTDVLSFPDGENGRLGDILISAAQAARQAARFGHNVEDELKILALHGLLHLLGYDHETDDGRMRRVEKRWRRKLGLPHSLTERGAGERRDAR